MKKKLCFPVTGTQLINSFCAHGFQTVSQEIGFQSVAYPKGSMNAWPLNSCTSRKDIHLAGCFTLPPPNHSLIVHTKSTTIATMNDLLQV